MKPHEFWGLTIGEFNTLVEGWAETQQLEMERRAWALSNLMSLFTKKPVTVDDLLGRKKKTPRGKRLFLDDVIGGPASLEEKLQRFDENWKKRKAIRSRRRRGRSKH